MTGPDGELQAATRRPEPAIVAGVAEPGQRGGLLPPPALAAGDALFLDFDGTLVDLAPTPDSIDVNPGLIGLLRQVQQRQQGALAIISGRELDSIDRWLAPLTLPAAGIHGAERRDAAGVTTRAAGDRFAEAAQALAPLVAQHPGLQLEPKRAALALHYRLAPELQPLCLQAMQALLLRWPGLKLLQGKCVLELLPQGIGKGEAVRQFMQTPPFAGRRAVFVGDDVTDEAGFEAVLQQGGIAIKVGAGPSVAPYRLDNTLAVRQWLQQALSPSPTHAIPV